MIIKHYNLEAESDLNSKAYEEGSVYFCSDTGRLFWDPIGGSTRVVLGGEPIILSTESEREFLLSPIPEKLYIVLATNSMYIYYNGEWNTIISNHNHDTVYAKLNHGTHLPNVTSEDDGKFLRVVDGTWSAISIPNAEEARF